MALKRTTRPRDPVQLGKLMVDIISGQVPDAVDDGKDAGAARLGKKGGASRAAKLTAEQRSEIARRGGKARWNRASDS
jgi:hypothetical protein